jgi:hypothetical protein
MPFRNIHTAISLICLALVPELSFTRRDSTLASEQTAQWLTTGDELLSFAAGE